MVKFKLSPADDIPMRGIYTKTAKTIIKEFEKSQYRQAVVENIEGIKTTRQFMKLYNAMKSLVRRENFKVQVSISTKEQKLYLAKI